MEKAKNIYSIMMLGMPMMGIMLGGMILFGSTDRIVLNIISSSLRGFIRFFPFIFLFSFIAIQNPGDMITNVAGHNGIFTNEFIF